MSTRNCRSYGRPATLLSILALVLIVAATGLAADTTEVVPPDTAVDTISTENTPPPLQKIDTSRFNPPADPTIAAQVTNPVDLEQYLHQPPTLALFKSMLVPGLGQLGNRKYVKAIVIAGLEGWFISKTVYWGTKAADAKDDFDQAVEIGDRNRLYDVYDYKRKKRNKFTWFAGITIFVSMFDAYVDAHMSGSPADERNERLSFDVVPNEYGGVSASLAYSF